jgi:hypothetical protein
MLPGWISAPGIRGTLGVNLGATGLAVAIPGSPSLVHVEGLHSPVPVVVVVAQDDETRKNRVVKVREEETWWHFIFAGRHDSESPLVGVWK